MDRNNISKIIVAVVDEYFEEQGIVEKSSEDTVLFGKNSLLDSMGLVNIIIEIESKLLDENIEISLTSDIAMSRRQSPFRTISTLVNFIEEQIITNKE